MASVVSYERDRARLLRQATEWSARADALEAASKPALAPQRRGTWLYRLIERLRR